jgi:hypothetical protein
MRCIIGDVLDINRNRNRVFAMSLLVMALVLAACAPVKKVALENALIDKQITATFRSRGTYGDIVVAAVTPNVDQAIELVVTPGSLLRNSTTTNESLVIFKYKGALAAPSSDSYQTNAAFVTRSKGAEQYAMLEAYSVNALADPALISDTFQLSGTASAEVQAVVNVLTDNDSIQAKQIAVWVVTDDITAQSLLDVHFPASPADLDSAKAILQRAKLDPAKYQLFAGKA